MVNHEEDYICMRTLVQRPTKDSPEPVYELVKYPLLSENEVAGGGQPMSFAVLKESIDLSINTLIEGLAEAKAQNNAIATEELNDQSIAITLGKESLFLILSQKDCDGIRFYFCKNPRGRNSVAAVGVKVQRDSAGQPQRDAEGRVIAQDIGAEGNHHSILKNKNLAVNILNSEVGPPYRLGEFLSGEKLVDSNDPFARDLKDYINKLR